MSRCRRRDAILEIAADPALGVDALAERHWDHIGVCADCTAAVRGLQRLDAALTATLRSLPRDELPSAVLATPPIPRAAEPMRFMPVLGAAAVVVLAVGLTVAGIQWLGLRGVGVAPGPSRDPSPSALPSPTPSSSAFATATPATSSTPGITPTPSPAAEPSTRTTLEVGHVAAVVDEPLVVRTAPGTDPDSTITADRLWIGQRVRILDGPADVDGYTWWEVEVGEIRGWVADGEADESAPWLSPIAGGEIYFWRYPGEGGVEVVPELFTIRADGSDELHLGDPTAAGLRLALSCGYGLSELRWTHDGSEATFEHSPGGCAGEVWVTSSDGSHRRRVGDGRMPSWRPDGRELAFAANIPHLGGQERGTGELLLAPVATVDVVPVPGTGGTSFAGTPSWSPDRTRLAFEVGVTDDDLASWDYSIHVVEPDGQGLRRIADGMRPRWSPDGRWIVYEVPATDGGTTLWRIRPDGTDAFELGDGRQAEFSPDGRELAFARDTGLWRMAAEGGDAELMIPATAIDGFAWSPDGEAVVVASNHAGGETIGLSVVRPGVETPAITSLTPEGHLPSWRPILVDPRLGG